MKDSGIEWIGEIPSHWKLKRLKALFEERKEKNDPIQTDFILSLGAAYGVVPYAEKEGGGNKAKEDLSDYRLAYPNDIVMNSMNIISGSVGISKYYGCVSPVYYMLYPRYYEEADPNYYCYMFQTKAFQRSLLGLGNGILIKESANGNFNTVRMRIPMEKLGVQLLPTPPLAEQKAIADFLDKQCAEIDSVIEQTKATIEEYKKLKQSVITEAVTKGIRGDRPMKDSGIEWIGEIPAEWSMQKMNRICSTITDYVASGSFASLAENVQYLDEPDYAMLIRTMDVSAKGYTGKPVYINKHAYDFLSNSNLFGGEIILPNIGASVGDIYIVPKLYERMSLAPNAIMIKTVISDKYVYYYYCGLPGRLSLLDIAQSTAQPKFNKTDFRQLKIPVPGHEEQEEIVSYLDQKCAEIDIIIEKKTVLLEEMEALKKSTIFEYVTGKKTV